MERRHQDILTNRLEEAHLMGSSHLGWNELYRWYGVLKIAARTYRDLEERWQSITNGVSGKLMKVEGRGGIFIFGEDKASPVDADS
jgi:hypothetical protein